MTPQQYRLSQLKPGRDTALVALNSSAVSLGGVFGPALGGLALASGFEAAKMPYASAALVFCALSWQLYQIFTRSKVVGDPEGRQL
jgi:predicted MFS family arabinose efflux permease